MKFLGGGKIETLIWLPEKRLVRETRVYGCHTEITKVCWKPNSASGGFFL